MTPLSDIVVKDTQEPRCVFFHSGCQRDTTTALRCYAIEQAIITMRTRFMEPLTLQDLASAAQFSPFHFNRVFRSMTGISPGVFLASIRLEQAKKLLLTTQRSVTDICFDVGYNSLGTFTSRFTQLVGIPPTRLRQLAKEQLMQASTADILTMLNCICTKQNASTSAGITGTIEVTGPFHGIIYVGAFASPLPQGQPLACALLTEPGRFHMCSVPDGEYYLFAAAMEDTQDLLSLLIGGMKLRGRLGNYSVLVYNGIAKQPANILLTPASWTDPPILIALPWLLISRFLQGEPLLA
ncbi:MAG: helix-turn-helix transcriptional regulator [Ktedonobacteraceae bacterium]|nr:helix-turn-helix transcriptional regulator [Ktedonobacteraceae bacterium]MBV9021489.1 helix-turn-helix transcriptional regulator [Ktedonobacteraceae bacterium]